MSIRSVNRKRKQETQKQDREVEDGFQSNPDANHKTIDRSHSEGSVYSDGQSKTKERLKKKLSEILEKKDSLGLD